MSCWLTFAERIQSRIPQCKQTSRKSNTYDTDRRVHIQVSCSANASEKLCKPWSDHVPPWAIPLITYLATADPEFLLYPRRANSSWERKTLRSRVFCRAWWETLAGLQKQHPARCQATGAPCASLAMSAHGTHHITYRPLGHLARKRNPGR